MAYQFRTNVDLAQNQLLNAAVQSASSSASISSPVNGQIYFDTTLHQFGVYNGTSWVYLTAATGANVSQVGNSASSGILKVSAGSNTNITDYAGGTGLIKSSASGVVSSATAGTDYLAPTGSGASLTGITESQVTNLVSDLAAKAPLASPTFTGTVTVPTTVNATDPAQKAYVDSVAQGLNIKTSAVAATTGSETYTISAGTVTQISGTTLDGQSPAVNSYILIKNAPASTGTGIGAGTPEPGNGLYQVTNATTNLTVSRAADMSGSNAPQGAFVFVESGTANGTTGWVVNSPAQGVAFTYGTTSMGWVQFSGAGTYSAGTGLTLTGSTFSVNAGTVPTLNQSTTGNAANVTGIVALANGGTGATSASGASQALSVVSGVPLPSKYSQTLSTSSTSYTITHNLGTLDVITQVYTVSGGAVVYCDIANATTNTVTLTFSVAPSSSTYRVVCIG